MTGAEDGSRLHSLGEWPGAPRVVAQDPGLPSLHTLVGLALILHRLPRFAFRSHQR